MFGNRIVGDLVDKHSIADIVLWTESADQRQPY
jgi:hypothetical protein